MLQVWSTRLPPTSPSPGVASTPTFYSGPTSFPPPTLSHIPDLVSLLQGHDPGSSSGSSAVARNELLGHVLQSANQCAEKRFLVVLDCYQATSEYTEIIVRMAVPV